MDPKDNEKKDRLLAALDDGMVMIHLDARRPGVLVPAALRDEAHLRLNLSYKFDPPDLTVGEWGVRSTLSFSGSRFTVAVPWSALFALTSYATRESFLYPDDMPQELIDAAGSQPESAAAAVLPPKQARKASPLREIAGDGERGRDGPDDEPPAPRGRGHLRVVK
jgi:stringent starvation protein B